MAMMREIRDSGIAQEVGFSKRKGFAQGRKNIELEVVPKRSGGWKTIDTTSGLRRKLVCSERALGEGWARFQQGKEMESVTRLRIKLLFFLCASFLVV